MQRPVILAGIGCLYLALDIQVAEPPQAGEATQKTPKIAHDWPRWRGPDGNGIATDGEINLALLSPSPKILWRVNVGTGYSAASLVGDRLYTMGYRDGNEAVVCLDASNGREVWRFAYASKTHGQYPGTRCTPLVAAGQIYTMGYEGVAHCLTADTGQLVWQADARQYGAVIPKWGISTSPVLAGSNILYNVAKHGLALRKYDGKVAWQSPRGGTQGYSSTVLYDQAGKQMGVFINRDGVFGVKADTGELSWSFPCPPKVKPQIAQYTADPVVWSNHVLASVVYSKGTCLYRVDTDQPQEVWAIDGACKSSSPILLDGRLYLPIGNKGEGALWCVDFLSGKTLWQQPFGTGISLTGVGSHLVVLTHKGELRIVAADPAGYRELAAGSIDPTLSAAKRVGFNGVWWQAPSYCRGMLYCRKDTGELVCVPVQ
jgi:outer membrane protein assembly factor BamB